MNNSHDEFIVEARERLAGIERTMLNLEQQGQPSEQRRQLVDQCLRVAHSLKGDAGFLGLVSIRDLAHAMESLLEAIREQASPLVPEQVEILLTARDRLSVMIEDWERSGNEDVSGLIASMKRLTPIGSATTLDLTKIADLPSFFSDLQQQASWVAPHLDLTGDLEQFNPPSSLHWRAELIPVESPQALLTFLQRSKAIVSTEISDAVNTWADRSLIVAEPERVGDSRRPVTIDLTAWSQETGGSLVELLSRLAPWPGALHAQLDFRPVDLDEQLPSEPVVWTSQASPVDLAKLNRLLGFEISDENFDAESEPLAGHLTPAPVPANLDQPMVASPSADTHSQEAKPADLIGQIEREKTSSLRINVELLDRLMTLVGELTLVRNQSLIAFAEQDGQARAIIQRLNSVTSELQETVMRTRMQPVGNLFAKFPRMVRDLARTLNKQIELQLEGREVELDKTILEQLSDPLNHLIRNSIDHGIELPQARITAGKKPAGSLILSARHEDGQVLIELRDDGKGINQDAIRARALANRLRSESELDRMSPRELYQLILLPGFTTTERVTEVSGRGVGMDVVKTNLDSLEGSLVIDSEPGKGTTMLLRVPLTLAIIPCLIITDGGTRYAVPQRELEEVVCLRPGSDQQIERAFDTEVFRLRNKLIPIVRLGEVLSRPEPFSPDVKSEILERYHASDQPRSKIEYIVVLRNAGKRFGLLVDEVRGTEEIVVKPMQVTMKRLNIYSGATIMGDGRVALILNVGGLVEHNRLSFESVIEQSKTPTVREAAEAHRLLLFQYGPEEQFALPLLQIKRIERIAMNRVERVAHKHYISLDGITTRIIRLDDVMSVSGWVEQEWAYLILPKFSKQPIGILVSRIVDTESLAIELQNLNSQERGILGTAVIRGKLSLLLDIHHVRSSAIETAETTANDHASVQHQATQATKGRDSARDRRLLIVDDTAFFREVVKRYFSEVDLQVTTAVHGQDALDKLAETDFDMIVSDIEMPVMDGWEFARQVRRRGIDLPMLALSSLSRPEHEAKAMECGYDGYEEKLDRDRLVARVKSMLDGVGQGSNR